MTTPRIVTVAGVVTGKTKTDTEIVIQVTTPTGDVTNCIFPLKSVVWRTVQRQQRVSYTGELLTGTFPSRLMVRE